MPTSTDTSTDQRTPLTRRRVLDAALALIDEHGLDALTVRKLGASLGVEGTAIYNHVDGKDGILDGVVELMWGEIRAATDVSGGWQDVLRSLAGAVRTTMHDHPAAGPLAFGRSLMPLEALQLMSDGLDAMEQAGFERSAAAEALIAVTGHAYGYALMELNAQTCGTAHGSSETEAQRIRRVAQTLPRDVPDELFEVGLTVCGADTEACFAAGIDLIVNGLDARHQAG